MTQAIAIDHQDEAEATIAAALLAWYDRFHRHLPWRLSPSEIRQGASPDPYRVWLSEIMLQQTRVSTVVPYFARFIERWPNVEALAAAEPDDVMKAWAGLGYYSRARNLKKCAEEIVRHHGGAFPTTEAELKRLPGIGDYTSAAIAAIAFGQPTAVVDGNVERVIARQFALQRPLPMAKSHIRSIVRDLLPRDRPGDFAQAMMDLGATICTPRSPSCTACPIRTTCVAHRNSEPEHYPVKAPKPEKPTRFGAAFVVFRKDDAVLLRRRPVDGLLGGMSEVPTTGWSAHRDGETCISAAPWKAEWEYRGEISHVFSHFALKLSVYRAHVEDKPAPAGYWWSEPEQLREEALPTLMRKAIKAAWVN